MATVDWTKPIEAIHADGRIERVTVTETDQATDTFSLTRRISPRLDEGLTFWFDEDGSHHKGLWTIRNVQPAASDEATTRALALVDRVARGDLINGTMQEARAIQALRTPVDPRIALVVTALVQNGVSRPVAPLFARNVLKALDAAVSK